MNHHPSRQETPEEIAAAKARADAMWKDTDKRRITEAERKAFEAAMDAIRHNDRTGLIVAKHRATGEEHVLIMAAYDQDNGDTYIYPFARLILNATDEYDPPA